MDIERIRKDFPILGQKTKGKKLVYLDNTATTQKPRAVIDAISDFYSKGYSNIHRGVYRLSDDASSAFEGARKAVAEFINAKSEKGVVFTAGTTASINLVASSFGKSLKKGDEVVVSEMEHHSNLVPWQALCEERGAKLRAIPVDEGGNLVLDNLDELITDKTKLVAVTYVSNVLGTVNPVKKIIAAAHKKGVPVLIDGAQAVQHMAVDVRALDCDFFVFSGHKMYAETGIGVLYAKRKWLDSMPPYQYGGGMISSVSMEKSTFAKPPLKFEAGTPNISGVISLKAAIEYMDRIGMDKIASHEKEVYDYALEKLGSIGGVTVYGNAPGRCGSIPFNIEGMHPYDAGLMLDRLGIAVRTGKHCAEPLMRKLGIDGCVRASFAVYNTKEEVDKLIEGIEKARELV